MRLNNKTKFRLSRPARISLGYVAAAALWIVLSDGLVAALVPDERLGEPPRHADPSKDTQAARIEPDQAATGRPTS